MTVSQLILAAASHSRFKLSYCNNFEDDYSMPTDATRSSSSNMQVMTSCQGVTSDDNAFDKTIIMRTEEAD